MMKQGPRQPLRPQKRSMWLIKNLTAPGEMGRSVFQPIASTPMPVPHRHRQHTAVACCSHLPCPIHLRAPNTHVFLETWLSIIIPRQHLHQYISTVTPRTIPGYQALMQHPLHMTNEWQTQATPFPWGHWVRLPVPPCMQGHLNHGQGVFWDASLSPSATLTPGR